MVSARTSGDDGRAQPTVLAVAAGNTRVRWGLFRGRELESPQSGPAETAVEGISLLSREADPEVVVLASVREAGFAERLRERVGPDLQIVGRDVMPPLSHRLRDASTLGVDRALVAYAAFSLIESACVVIDAGTAIKVDFVDGEGTFCGGAIAPGLRMMLRSLHEHTAALPDLEFELPPPADGPFGLDTAHAMRLGVLGAARGLVREQVERYSEAFGAYPRVVATGGDAAALFETDELVERVIPELQLIGIQRSVEHALEAEG